VIDVDGSYLPCKYEQLKQAGIEVAPLSPPPIPPGGWEVITEDNHRDMAEKIPIVLPGKIPSSPPHHMHMHIHLHVHIYVLIKLPSSLFSHINQSSRYAIFIFG